MAYSQVGIANLALYRCKTSAISSLTEASQAARIVNAVWEYVRDEVLAAYPWNFAKARATLAQDTTAPTYGYDYRYAKPSNCLRILEVVQSDAPVDYVEEGDYLLTDADNTDADLYIRYITVISDCAKWPPMFINAFAWRLAAEVGSMLESVNTNDLMNKYQLCLIDAKGHNQMQEAVHEPTAGTWEAALSV